jgi:hypothetical protein
MANSKQTDSQATETTITQPAAVKTAADFAGLVSSRRSYLAAHPTARKDRIDSRVAVALNRNPEARAVAARMGLAYWTGPDVSATFKG